MPDASICRAGIRGGAFSPGIPLHLSQKEGGRGRAEGAGVEGRGGGGGATSTTVTASGPLSIVSETISSAGTEHGEEQEEEYVHA